MEHHSHTLKLSMPHTLKNPVFPKKVHVDEIPVDDDMMELSEAFQTNEQFDNTLLKISENDAILKMKMIDCGEDMNRIELDAMEVERIVKGEKMVDESKLNGFLEEASEVIKNSMGCTELGKPLRSIRFGENENGITFDVELRGAIADAEAFSLVGRLDGSNDKYFSRGFFTPHSGHCTSFAISHDEPRGMSLQQGLFIEMKNILARMLKETGSEFVKSLLKELESMQVKVQVVKSDADALESVSDAGLEEHKAEIKEADESIGKLELSPGTTLVEQQTEAACEALKQVEPPEDTCGESFARAVGDREEKPEEDNPIDSALESTHVYNIRKATLWGRIVKWFRKLFGLDKEREQLESVCSDMFCKKDGE